MSVVCVLFIRLHGGVELLLEGLVWNATDLIRTQPSGDVIYSLVGNF
jgi:hypothetical protein